MRLDVLGADFLRRDVVLAQQLPRTVASLLLALCLPQLLSPCATRMQGIPPCHLAFIPTTTWVMVTEAIHPDVPDGSVVLDEEPFCHRNPQRRHDEVATKEVVGREIARRLDRSGVLCESPAQCPGVSRRFTPPALASARWDCLTDVDRHRRVGRSNDGVEGEWPRVEQCVYASAKEVLLQWQLERPTPHQFIDAVAREVRVVEGVVFFGMWLHFSRAVPTRRCAPRSLRGASAQRYRVAAWLRTMPPRIAMSLGMSVRARPRAR